MKIVGPALALKNLRDCAAGELVRIGYSGNGQEMQAIAIVLEAATDTRHAFIGYLDHAGGAGKSTYYDDDCISLGTEWTIEPVQSSGAFPRNSKALQRKGAYILTPKGPALAFYPSEGVQRSTLYLLPTFEEVQFDKEHGAAIPSWQIWLEEGDRSRPGAEPAFVFK